MIMGQLPGSWTTVQALLNSCNGVLMSPTSGNMRTSQFMYLMMAAEIDSYLYCGPTEGRGEVQLCHNYKQEALIALETVKTKFMKYKAMRKLDANVGELRGN